MSFLGGGDASCSTGANPLSQFSKHVQDDKSLQRDRMVGRGGAGMAEGFRSGPAREMQGDMMNEFMQQPSMEQSQASPFAMEQMRREFENLHTSAAQSKQNGSSPGWASEFDPGMADQAAQKPGGFNPADFERFVQMKQAEGRMASPAANNGMHMNGYQGMGGMGGMGMGGIYGGMGMMQRPYGGMSAFPQPMSQAHQQQPDGKGKGRMVELDDKDWEAQFAELEHPGTGLQDADMRDQRADALDEEANKAMEAELDQIDRSVPSNKPRSEYMQEFERKWNQILAETPGLSSRTLAEGNDMPDFSDFENFDMGTHYPRDPQLGNYTFEADNIFTSVQDPFEEGVRIMDEGGNLSLAALAFEAAVQKNSDHVEAWTRLGAAQAQNEKETPAIRALEQAVKLDPSNLDALMGLAVSYTNEGYDSTAYRTLERWLGAKYPQIVPPRGSDDELNAELSFTDRQNLHQRVTELFIQAAQLSPDATQMDADVQVGLGVLFYGAEEYDKAVDCFSAALQSNESASLTHGQSLNQRPLLWNRLGATLANSGRSEEAIHAYEKALELNPNFVRARYNLGVSCINIGCLPEAAQHLLGALDMHKMVEREGREKAREIVEGAQGGAVPDAEAFEKWIRQNESTNLYDTLRRVFGQMDRRDLADKVMPGMDPTAFKGEFDF